VVFRQRHFAMVISAGCAEKIAAVDAKRRG